MKKGLIYILTNKSFNTDKWVKIGYTTNLEERIRTLSNTSLPYDYEVYATYETPESVTLPDKTLHKLIAKLNPNLRLVPDKEFFAITPEDAYAVLEAMAKIHGRAEFLKKYSETKVEVTNRHGVREIKNYDEEHHLLKMSSHIQTLYRAIEKKAKETHNDYTIEYKKNYVSFKKNSKNVFDIEPHSGVLKVYINIRNGSIVDPENRCEFIRDIGHWGNGDYRFRISDSKDIEYLFTLIEQSYKRH